MRRVAFMLIVASLVSASIAAMTAYVPRLDDVSSGAVPTLNAPAGLDPSDPSIPLYDPEASDEPIALTDEVIENLRSAGVERVRVREFSFATWDLWWLFVLSVAGLIAGGLVLRHIDRRKMSARLARRGEQEDAPEDLLEATDVGLRALLDDLESLPASGDRLKLIRDRVDALQQDFLVPFIEARPHLVARMGMARYARLMDRFAASERQINRAWSAAADEHLEEARTSLKRAQPPLATARALLDDYNP